MEFNDLKKWLELARDHQADNPWKQIFEDKEAAYLQKNTENPFLSLEEYFPKCDLYEAEGNIVVEMEIPGIRKEDINISINHQSLTISGEFKTLHSHRKYFLKERINRKFKKELTLPVPVHYSNTSSEVVNGVLVIRFPMLQDDSVDIPIDLLI